MTRDEIIKMAREVGTPYVNRHYPGVTSFGFTEDALQRFAALVAAAERESRQAAQIENKALKARIACADVELQRAVITEREACAKVLIENAELCTKNKLLREILEANADAIRARGAA